MKDYGKLWDKTTSALSIFRRWLCDAYDLGYKHGSEYEKEKQHEGYKKGLKVAWRYIKDIIEIWEDSDDGETKDIFGYEDLTDIVNKLEVDEAFDKLNAYKKSKNDAPEVANCRKCRHSTGCATDIVVCDINGTTQYKWHLGCKDYDPKEDEKPEKIEVGDEVVYAPNNEKYIVTWVGSDMVNAIKEIDGTVVQSGEGLFTKTGIKFVDISLEMLIGEKS